MKQTDKAHLQWIHDRIVNVYGENENVDFLIKMREIISNVNVYDNTKDKRKIIEQAKEMEKDRMIEFANSFYDNCGMQYGGLEKSAEEYYNETYNTETK
jgi:uncharacterized membrane protein